MKNLIVSSDNEFRIKKLRVHKIVSELKKELGFNLESLEVNFLNKEVIKEINVNYLNHDYSTDIITFNYSGSTRNLDGEIFISFEDAKENAEKYNCTLANEILRLVIHGILHLLGYDDMNEKDKNVMKKLENSLVIKFDELSKGLMN